MSTQDDIVATLTELVIETLPDATMREMYGGTVIELVKDTPKSRIGGFYAYADHVSLELAEGKFLDDPGGLLEGSGKARRHVKLYGVEDVTGRNCAGFLVAAAARKAQP